MVCINHSENISHVPQLLLLCLKSDEELDYEALELTSAFECIHLHSDVNELITRDLRLVDHDIEPLMLQ